MKSPLPSCRSTRSPRLTLVAFFALAIANGAFAAPVYLEFTAGLAGDRTKLTWETEPGARYRIERSQALGGEPGDAWETVALVTASGTGTSWIDPELLSSRAFYRIVLPAPEVHQLHPPLLGPSGGAIVVEGQGFPAGAELVIAFEGGGSASAPLVDLGGGFWIADFTGSFTPGALSISVVVVDGGGGTVATSPQIVTITNDGRAIDGPPSLPPAAPVSKAARPVAIKTKGTGADKDRVAGGGRKEECDDSDTHGHADDLHVLPATQFAVNVKGTGASGNRIFPASSGLPGEVSFHVDALALDVPAGPPVSWVMTYRSIAEVESGHGIGWDHAYNISIEPLPAAAREMAPRVRVRDGGGRCDIYFRQPDGTYRCDGHFREGEFTGSSFTLRFPNGGKWEFQPIDGSPAAGKISAITDPNGLAVTCAYDGTGKLSTVSNSFGQSLSLAWTSIPGAGERIDSVTDQTGRSVSFVSFTGEAGGSTGDLKEIAAPAAAGHAPASGPLQFTYATGHADARLNHNLLQVIDGLGRVLEHWEYRSTTTPTAPDYDTIAAHHAHASVATRIAIEDAPFGTIHGGGRVATVNDEVGRVTRHHFDRSQRLVKIEEFTGFATPGVDSTLTANLPSGPVRPSVDPAVFTTTFTRNRDDGVTSLVHSDGSGLRVVFAGDVSSSCPVLERGNASSIELVGATGRDGRVIRLHHASGAGTSENARPGNPIRGIIVKGGRNPGGDIVPNARPGGPVRGVLIKIGREPGPDLNPTGRGIRPGRTKFKNIIMKRGESGTGLDEMLCNTGHFEFGTASLFSGSGAYPYPYYPDSDDDGSSTERAGGPRRRGWDGTVKFDNDNGLESARAGGGGRKGWDGVIYGNPKRLAIGTDPLRPDSDGDSPTDSILRPGSPVSGCFIEPACRAPMMAARVTRLVTAFGEIHQWTYDGHGNCKSWTSPIAGRGAVFDYDSAGRCTRVTLFNGASPLIDELSYDSASGFLESTTGNPGGAGGTPPLVHSFSRDALGQVIRSTDATGADWEYDYNALGQITTQRGPQMPARHATHYIRDAGGRIVRIDADHADHNGNPLSANPVYSTIIERDSRGRISRIAEEEIPVDVGSATEAAAVGLNHFAAVDFTRDDAGQVTLIEVPAVCRDQTAVLALGIQYDERGLVHRLVRGGGAPGSVTEEFDYNAIGETTLCAVVGGPASPSLVIERDAFHRPTRGTDAMGNETVLEYDNEGVVTTSYFGQTEDISGSAGNILMARYRHHYVGLNFHKLEWGYRGYTTRRRVEVLKSHREASPGYVAPCDADTPLSIAGSHGWICPPLDVFLSRDRKDDVVETDRFEPGAPGPHPVETTEFIHTPAGLLSEVKRNGDTIATITRDGAGRMSACSDGAVTVHWQRDGRGDVLVCQETSHSSAAGSPDKTFTWSSERDPLGRPTRMTDGAGNEWTASYDSVGRCLSFVEPGRAPLIIAHESIRGLRFYSVFVIQGAHSDTSPIERGGSVVRSGEFVASYDSHGQATIHTRDALGRLTRCDFPDGTFLAYSHDARGFVHQFRLLDGETRTLDVDAAGRTTRVTSSDPAFPVTEYSYDSRGHVSGVGMGSTTVTAVYDSTGNQTGETCDDTPAGLPPESFSISRTFNARGRTGIIYPDGRHFLEERDALGRLLSISQADGSGLPLSPPIVEITYLGHRVARTKQANNVTTEYQYRGDGDAPAPGGLDASFGHAITTTVRKDGTTLLARVIQRRGPDQRLIARSIQWSDDPDAAGRRHEYGLDDVGQLISRVTERRESTGGAWIPESSVTYELDTEGKRLTATGGDHPGSYFQNPANPPGDLAMHQYSTWPRGNLEWDDNGNIVSVETDGGVLTFDHDAAGRLTACRPGVGAPPVVTYDYDGLGRRIARVEYDGSGTPISRVRYVHDGSVCIQEWSDDGSGTSSAALTHVASNGIRHCISTRAGTLYYPHGNSARHWGDPHVELSKGVLKDNTGAFTPAGEFHPPTLIADAAGNMLEGNDCDDAGKFIFLGSSGLPTGSIHPIGPIRWMAPEAMLDEAIGLTLGTGIVYSPDIGSVVSKEKAKDKKPRKTYVGHVTVMR